MADIESIQPRFQGREYPDVAVAYCHLRARFPYLDGLFAATGEMPINRSPRGPTSEAVVRIIAGQMLSGTAAETIYARLVSKAMELGVAGTHLLPVEQIRDCGLSRAKARAITEFSDSLLRDPGRFENWSHLEYDSLRKDVTALWGLSDWSASILALSHFGIADVWPASDGSIQRAVSIVRASHDGFDPAPGSPYRSYLARSLWAALDSGYFNGPPWQTG